MNNDVIHSVINENIANIINNFDFKTFTKDNLTKIVPVYIYILIFYNNSILKTSEEQSQIIKIAS